MVKDIKMIEEMLEKAVKNSEGFKKSGEVASYIPELANADADNYGVALVMTDGKTVVKGDRDIKFSIQSISKVIDLIVATEDSGFEKVFSKVGTEPTEYKFNSIIPITDKAVNPLINAGAITTCSLIKGESVDEKFIRVMNRVRELSGSDDIVFLENVYNSEMQTTDINRSISYYLKSRNIIEGNAEEILDLYVRNCSIGVNTEQLARIAAVLANGGKSLDGKEQLISEEAVKVTLALMSSCGMYEESGRYLVKVGFPSKSGVSGAIMGIVPGKCGICTYSPRLDQSGNSIRGRIILEELSSTLDLNIFVQGE